MVAFTAQALPGLKISAPLKRCLGQNRVSIPRTFPRLNRRGPIDGSTHNDHIPRIGWLGRAAQSLDLLGAASTQGHENHLIHVQIDDLIQP